MTYEELANEVVKDYEDVYMIMRKKIPDALKSLTSVSMVVFSTGCSKMMITSPFNYIMPFIMTSQIR